MVDRSSRVVLVCVLLFFLLIGFTVEQQLSLTRRERLALLQLRSSLGLRAREWPIKSDPCTTWAGIQCTNGGVTGINISGFKRTRRGSQNPNFSIDALQNFTLLSSFNASNFALLGSIPDWLGSWLGALQVLDLRSCSITGSIPFTIGNLSSLAELYLSGNNISGTVPTSLGQLINLSVVNLSRNSLTGLIPGTFSSLKNLTSLDMSSNFLTGTIPLEIGTLSSLQFLNLSGNSLSSSIPAQLGDLSRLVDLDLSFNSLSGSIPRDLRGLRNLQRLVIRNNLLSQTLPSDLFSPLTQLEQLVLSNNSFTGEFPFVLWSMPQLQLLDASRNNFTGELPDVINNGNGSSTIFDISENFFYGNLTSFIRRFSFTNLSGNYFQGGVPDFARGNTSLTRNCLRNTASQRNLSDCAAFYAERGLAFDDFGLPNSPPKSDKKSHRTVIILASVFGAAGLIVLLAVMFVLLILCRRKTGGTNQKGVGVGPIPASPPGASLSFSNLGETFTYKQILEATGEFSDANLIKNGHSGDFFRGVLDDGNTIVVKKIDLSLSTKKEEYMVELELFNKVSHQRLVPLLGHCLENENEKFLVYKYMPNGDLSSSLFRKRNSEDGSLQSLDWITRLKIAIGAAEGLSYLHHECYPPFVHRDIRTSSILLDDKFEVRLGSLSEICVQEGDPHQNRISRLLRFPQTSDQGTSRTLNSTCAHDVYCFGKVLLELVTGKLDISSTTDAITKEWLESTLPYISIYDKELVTNIVDPSLIIDEDLLEEVWAMAIVARSCLNPKPTRRPLMRYVLKALENPLKVVRDEHTSSARLRTTSSRGSWNAALFGSWRQSSSDVAALPAQKVVERGGSDKPSGTTGSQESERLDEGRSHSFSTKRHSREIFPEPLNEQDIGQVNEE